MFQEAARQLLVGCDVRRHGLAQLALQAGGVDEQLRPSLLRAAAREAADAAVAERESASILEALAPLRPAVLKGAALSQRWPQPRLRPAGDLDLLLEQAALSTAVTTLCDRGFRVGGRDLGGRLRPAPAGVELLAPEGCFVNADLHTRPFRSVGGRLDGATLLSRARPAQLLGQPVRLLDPADELLYLLVHAAKHGACAPKWLLDIWVTTQRFDDWERLVERAREAGATRPAWAAAQLVAQLPGSRIPQAFLSSLRPALVGRLLSRALVYAGSDAPEWQRYARELVLEESAWSRLRRLGGVAERIFRRD